MPMTEVVGRILGAMVALVLVLLAAWMLLRWMGSRMPGMGGGGASRLVKVLDRVNVGKGSCILLLRVQDKVLLVAMTEHGTEKLCEFDDPDGTMMPPVQAEVPAFSTALKDAARRMMGKEPQEPAGEPSDEQPPAPDNERAPGPEGGGGGAC